MKSGPFVGSTSYKDEYKPFVIEAGMEEYSPVGARKEDSRVVKFEGESSYKSAYHSLPIPKIDRYRHPEYRSLAPFTGASSYKSQFSPIKLEPAPAPSPTVPARQVKF